MLVWSGISQLDNSTPIGLFITGNSRNAKTGNMIQTWIMRLDMEPNVAVKSASDDAICGDCPYRAGAGCYVTTHQAPLSVWRAHKGKPIASMVEIVTRFEGSKLRIGSYGDPCAIPLTVWQSLIKLIKPPRRTGYTHQWRTFPAYRSLLMASVDTEAEQAEAIYQGWRTFRVSKDGTPLKGEIECPNTTHNVSCADCGLCDGSRSSDPHTHYLQLVQRAQSQRGLLGFATPVMATSTPAVDKRRSIVIAAHGAKKGRITG
jgi:hypothetical protein